MGGTTAQTLASPFARPQEIGSRQPTPNLAKRRMLPMASTYGNYETPHRTNTLESGKYHANANMPPPDEVVADRLSV